MKLEEQQKQDLQKQDLQKQDLQKQDLQKQDLQKREPRRSPQTAGERARAERDLRMGAHPIQGEQENDAYKA